MSTSLNSQRPYPLSPPPHSETKQAQEISYQQPQTPESPAHPVSNSPNKLSPTEVAKHSVEKPFTASYNNSNEAERFLSTDNATATMEDVHQNLSMESRESSNKRKREVEDNGDQEQKKVHVEDRRLGIEDLHLDVGKIYLLCRTRKAPNSLNNLICLERMCFEQYLCQVFYASSTAVFG
jgi:hypothetical protein